MTENNTTKKILIVEDEELIRDSLAEIVSSIFDFEVDVVTRSSTRFVTTDLSDYQSVTVSQWHFYHILVFPSSLLQVVLSARIL